MTPPTASFPVYGLEPPSPGRLSLSSVDEVTEGPETEGPETEGPETAPDAGEQHQWMVRSQHQHMDLFKITGL